MAVKPHLNQKQLLNQMTILNIPLVSPIKIVCH